MAAPSDFRALEADNRQDTVILIAVVVLLYGFLGLGFDFYVGDIQFLQGRPIGFPLLTVAALIFAGFQSLISFYAGTSLILASVHARELYPDSPKHQMVLDVIHEMALAARMPVPHAYVMDDPAPNAFATGRDPFHSVVCVTQGLVDNMDREELQGVLGHEMAHIRDYDIRTMMIVAILVGGIAMLSDFFFRWNFYGGRRSSSRSDDSNGEAGTFIAVAVIVLAILAPLLSQLIAMAVSREREYLADASSVEFTRNPRALLRALEHIAQIESPLKEGVRGTAHLFIVNPLHPDADDDEGFFANLFGTHPPLSRRIARLRAMLGASAPQTPISQPA